MSNARQCSLTLHPAEGNPVRLGVDPEGPITLAPGVKPSAIVAVRVPRAEFLKLGELTLADVASVDLELWFSRPIEALGGAAPDVTLRQWRLLPRVDEPLVGYDYDVDGQPDPNVRIVYEQRWLLADRRWEIARRKGAVTARGNELDAEHIDLREGTTAFTNSALGERILEALGIELTIPASADAVMAPANIDLRMADAVAEWTKWEQATDHVLKLSTDGDFSVVQKAVGEPVLPAAQWELFSSEHMVASDAPDAVVFTSAPNRRQIEETFTLEELEYVGLEATGELRPLDLLSYAPGTWTGPIQSGFSAFSATNRALAFQSVGRFLRLKLAHRAAKLPFLAERIRVANGERSPVLVEHEGCQLTNPSTGAFTSGTMLPVFGVQFDPRLGLLVLPHPAWKLTGESRDPYASFDGLLAGAQLRASIAYEASAGEAADFYQVAYRRGPGGPEIVADPQEVLNAEGTKVLQMPYWQPMLIGAELVNKDAMDAEAADLAAAILTAGTAGIQTRRYQGFHTVQLSGAVSEVTWDFAACETIVKLRQFSIAASRWGRAAALAVGGAMTSGGSSERALLNSSHIAGRLGAGRAAPAVLAGFGLPAALPGGGGGHMWAFVSVSEVLNGSGTGHAADPTTQWLYTFAEAMLQDNGYGYWMAKSGGRTGTCRNTYEAPNFPITAASPNGTLGIGIPLISLDYDEDGSYELFLTPPPPTVPVMLFPVRLVNGTITWWFSHLNQIGGGCD